MTLPSAGVGAALVAGVSYPAELLLVEDASEESEDLLTPRESGVSLPPAIIGTTTLWSNRLGVALVEEVKFVGLMSKERSSLSRSEELATKLRVEVRLEGRAGRELGVLLPVPDGAVTARTGKSANCSVKVITFTIKQSVSLFCELTKEHFLLDSGKHTYQTTPSWLCVPSFSDLLLQLAFKRTKMYENAMIA